VSGSGPGYIFAITEDLIDATIAEGLAPEVADRLARQMLLGSSKLLASKVKSAAALKSAVAGPKGTTEAGLSLSRLISQAVSAAHWRARELGD